MKPTILILLVALALLAAGCGSDEPDTTEPVVPLPSEESGESPGEPSEERADAPSGGAQTGAAPAGADVTFVFESLFERQRALEYTATFEVVGTGPGMPAPMTMTQYFGGVDRLRVDSTVEGSDSRAYIIDGEFTACSEFDGEWMCFPVDVMIDTTQEVDELIETGEYTVGALPPRSVADANAQCFMLTMVEEETHVEYCFSPEGVPLFIESRTEVATMTWTAIDYSLSVPHDAWDVPESTGFPEGFDPSMFT
ncbi:MAG: hypothetical protein ACMXYM_02850 [Candidatus Woesearchaeota archaeon]